VSGTETSERARRQTTILDITFLNIGWDDALALIRDAVRGGVKRSLYFVNAHCFNVARTDEEFRSILNRADYVFPDGSGVRLACRMLGEELSANLNGTDLLPRLCEMAVADDIALYLLGAKPEIAERMKANLEARYPGLRIVGTQHGYFDRETESDAVVESINASGADVVLVAFGVPMQEKWVHANREALAAPLVLGVGGLLDFYSGNIKRAPAWVRALGLEWVFRLLMEPRRMWRRYIVGNPLFVYRVWRWRRRQCGQV